MGAREGAGRRQGADADLRLLAAGQEHLGDEPDQAERLEGWRRCLGDDGLAQVNRPVLDLRGHLGPGTQRLLGPGRAAEHKTGHDGEQPRMGAHGFSLEWRFWDWAGRIPPRQEMSTTKSLAGYL